MIYLVSGSTDVDLDTVAVLVRRQGLKIQSRRLPLDTRPDNIRTGVKSCFLIFTQSGVVTIGENVEELRDRLGPLIPLNVCAPLPTAEDRRTIHECGATNVITPSDWTAHAITDRILAELIVQEEVRPSSLGSILGASLLMQELYDRIERVAPLHEPVLVLGETGCGKELVAKEIHARSRTNEKLVAINCAALTPELLESELFGHERGAFTGATEARRGLIVEAGHGTVFLDEIGDLAPSSQAKLLRVLEERTARPVGSNRWHPVKARFVLATNIDLQEACLTGRFRPDLYHRISSFILHLPPLRERKQDLLLLAGHFLQQINREYSWQKSAPPGAFDPLFRYHWPGNVRELRQAVLQAAVYSPDREISVAALNEWIRHRDQATAHAKTQLSFDPLVDTWKDVQDRTRANYFQTVLEIAHGNKDTAAKMAGISRSQFYDILKQIQSSSTKED